MPRRQIPFSHHDRATLHHQTKGRVPIGIRQRRMRTLVTGGAGFVGSHLVDKLMARGDEVIVIDNFFTGRKENVLHHLDNPRFELIRHDVVQPILLEVDQIYHLACPASPVHYKYNPIKTIISFTNVIGTLNMLGLAKRVKARFLITSTSEVYGDPLEHPQKESYWGHVNPIGVRSCYDEGKRMAETLTMDYYRNEGVEVRIARIFNTYGPRMCLNDRRVVSNFVSQALRKEPMTVYGDGKQTRSFQYVSDLVDGLMALMGGEHIGPFNLGNPGEFTMLELARVYMYSLCNYIGHGPILDRIMQKPWCTGVTLLSNTTEVPWRTKVVKDTIDSNVAVEFRENTADDPQMRKPDISKAKALLNWEPKVPLRDGLPRMALDFRNRILKEEQDSITLDEPSSSTLYVNGGGGGRAIDRHNPIIQDEKRLGQGRSFPSSPAITITSPITTKKPHRHHLRKQKPEVDGGDKKKKSVAFAFNNDEFIKRGNFISPASSSSSPPQSPPLEPMKSKASNMKHQDSLSSSAPKPPSPPQSPPPPPSTDKVVVLEVSLHCRGCERKMKKHISKLEGVTSFKIEFAAKKVTVVGDVTPLAVLTSVLKVKNAKLLTPATISSPSSQTVS
ncbi:UDP-glucuronic acid decarboxylase 1 [Artemisia annua]|uniref:UDP-glucuronate decarboxylase n=1 Tax=Artemisia annua TaxID=35608 RepID=A0A2U1NHQ8_ARTAN|nr:UDP-glucuronic acid decarboxylase 1 [Artemisia annua]